MNSDHSGKTKLPGEILPGEHVKPSDVPVFNCIVYVSSDAGGGMRARVANLAGLECIAGSEREALAKVVSAFKQRVSELTRSESPIPWIVPPSTLEPGEQTRFVAVHL